MNKDFKKIKNILSQGIEKEDFPGAQFCYINKGEVYCDYIGYKEIYPEKVKLNGSEVYDIASLSKVVSTTILILQAIEENKITLETKIQSILPEYFDPNTTIYQLLTHTSGLNPIVHNASKIQSKEELIKQIYLERFVYDPGTKIAYSDTGFMLLGFILENIYNEKISNLASEKIFKPLKMQKTTYYPKIEYAVPTEKRGTTYVRGEVHDERAGLMNGESGHAGVFSTAKDLSKFIKSILSDEKILKKETKKELINTTVVKNGLKGEKLVRSLGYQKFSELEKTHNYLITHTGFTGCNMWIDFEKESGFVLLTNAIHPKREKNKIFGYRKQILNHFYQQ